MGNVIVSERNRFVLAKAHRPDSKDTEERWRFFVAR
jgi:hypothetical protein